MPTTGLGFYSYFDNSNSIYETLHDIITRGGVIWKQIGLNEHKSITLCQLHASNILAIVYNKRTSGKEEILQMEFDRGQKGEVKLNNMDVHGYRVLKNDEDVPFTTVEYFHEYTEKRKELMWLEKRNKKMNGKVDEAVQAIKEYLQKQLVDVNM